MRLDEENMHVLQEQIWSAVHDLVDKLTQTLEEDQDEELRQRLTESFRFWRRV